MADLASYTHAASTIPLLNDTIGSSLEKAASRWPNREAVVVYDQGIRLTFAELHDETNRLAAGLIALDLPPGARIGIWSPNRMEWVLTQYAAAKAGLILVNINPAYRLTELEFALNKVECRALVTADRFKTTDYMAMLRALAPELDHCDPGALRAERLPYLTTLIHMAPTNETGFYAFDTVRDLGGQAEHVRLKELAALLQPDDPTNILFTSGTTGPPKAATLTHHSTLNNAFFVGLMMGVSEGDRFCRPLPLYHVGGMVLGSVLGIVHGVTVIYLGEAFDPQVALESLQNERCTLFVGVPTMFVSILNHPAFAQYDLTRLRLGFIVGAPCPAELRRRIVSKTPIRDVMIGYGMTEASGGISQTSPSDKLERQAATVGRAHPHTEIKIVDPEGRMVPRGTQGEICVRGYMVMQGYWNDEPATHETINRAHWLHSGDLGTMDADGYIAITGRSKEMVIRGGENIYPREIEEFLFRHPAIADVHGFGVPDEHFGEELCVWIKLRSGATISEEDIRAFCREQITHFKIPRYIRFVDAFPMTVTGKVQKFMMQEAMAAELAAATIRVGH